MNIDFSKSKDEIIDELLSANKILRRMLDRASDGIFIVDGRNDSYGNSLYCNPALYNLLGVQSEEIIGRNIEDYQGKFVNKMATMSTMKNKASSTVIQTMVRTNRKAVVTSTPIYDEYNNLVCFFVQVRDIVSYEEAIIGDEAGRDDADYTAESTSYYVKGKKQLVAQDSLMLDTLDLALKLAHYDLGVLLYGETGAGKEVIAQYIHDNSPRKQGPFVTVNCATFQKELIESELFGYESGAFTGAKKSGKIGLIEAAKGGTLFLDEINSLPLDLQGKLLRVIETKRIRAVGSNKEKDVDFRLICATNEKLENLLKNKAFREDLFYRINTFSINIPPLRERPGDIRPLLEHFTKKYADKYQVEFHLKETDVQKALHYNWPGNVRELRNFAEQLVVIGSNPILGTSYRMDHALPQLKDNAEAEEAKELPPHKAECIADTHPDSDMDAELKECIASSTGTLKERMAFCEREILRQALKKNSFKRDVAKELGIAPAVLSRKIAKYEL